MQEKRRESNPKRNDYKGQSIKVERPLRHRVEAEEVTVVAFLMPIREIEVAKGVQEVETRAIALECHEAARRVELRDEQSFKLKVVNIIGG